MNFTESDYLILKNEIDTKCHEILISYLSNIEIYKNLESELYFIASGKLEGIIICFSALDIPEETYYSFYRLVSRYQNKLSELHVKGDLKNG